MDQKEDFLLGMPTGEDKTIVKVVGAFTVLLALLLGFLLLVSTI